MRRKNQNLYKGGGPYCCVRKHLKCMREGVSFRYRVTNTGLHFRDDCTEFIQFFCSCFPSAVNFIHGSKQL